MTPKELCDLAAKINAAVPGLVPPYEIGEMKSNKYVATQDRHGWEYNPLPGAAALMLGLCWAWTQANEAEETGATIESFREVWDCTYKLLAYVATTLPGARQ